MSTESATPGDASSDAWKKQGEAERAAREAAQDSASNASGPRGAMPAADFAGLVEMLATQALMALGQIAHPTSGKSEPQLPLARHFIDLLGVIEAKSAGNLAADETSLLGGTLHFLRMNYIEISRKGAEPKSG